MIIIKRSNYYIIIYVERALAKEPKWLVKWSSLEFKESLGPGTVGEFYRALWKDKEVAVKCLINQKVSEDDILELTANTVILRYLFFVFFVLLFRQEINFFV